MLSWMETYKGQKHARIVTLSIFLLLASIFASNTKQEYASEETNSNIQFNVPQGAMFYQFWNNTYGNATCNATGYDIWTNGSAIYTVGMEFSIVNILLVKWDMNGQQVWNRTWDGGNVDQAFAIWGDNVSIYTAGQSFSPIKEYDFVLVRWDADGNQIWNRTWGGTGNEFGYYDVAGVRVGGETVIYGTGSSTSYSSSEDIVVLKWHENGTLLWNVSWGAAGSNLDRGYGIWANDTDVFVTGMTGGTQFDIALVRWAAADGALQWNSTWGGSLNDYATALWANADQTLFISGNTRSYGAGSYDILLLKTDLNGTVLWNRTWGGSSEDRLTDSSGGGMWVDEEAIWQVGLTASYGQGLKDVAFVKWSLNGDIKWNATWGGPEDEEGIDLFKWGNDLYTIGYTRSFVSLPRWILLLKFGDYDPPGTPTLNPIVPNLSTNGSITLNWSDVQGADIYTVYRHASPITQVNGSVSVRGITSTSSFTDSVAAEGTYYYAVVARNATGVSNVSNSESVVVDLPGPGAPVLGPITPNPSTNGSALLDWANVLLADNYTVYRHTSPITQVNGSVSVRGITSTSSFTDAMGTEGTYYYAVLAHNATGDSPLSNTEAVVVDLPGPVAPFLYTILPSTSTTGIVIIDWSDVPETTAYIIYRSFSPITDVTGLTPIATLPAPSAGSTFEDKNLPVGVFYYAVVAVSVTGMSPPSNSASVTVALPGPNDWITQVIVYPVLGTIVSFALGLLLRKAHQKRSRPPAGTVQ